MEEQTVPSAGFSPQPESYDSSDYMDKYPNYGPILSALDDSSSSYGNLADTFDLSLLGDSYDDHDMATVPSPSWSPSGSMESWSWQQMSLYAASPASADFRAFSPECTKTGSLSPIHHPSFEAVGRKSHSPSLQTPLGGESVPDPSTCDRHLLLRQCLEDTSFQRKYNFKPLDLASAALLADADSLALREMGPGAVDSSSVNTQSVVVPNGLELNQIEPVFSLAFEHIRSDIQNICNNLAISPDPVQWSVSDVQSWLTHTLTTLGGNDGMSTDFFKTLDGRMLCCLNEEEFRRRNPVNGDRLFANLELWKMVQGKQMAASDSVHFLSSQQQQDVLDLEDLLLMPSPGISTLQSRDSMPRHDVKVKLEVPSSMDAVQSPPVPEVVNTDEEMEEEEEEERPAAASVAAGGKVKSGGGSGGGKSGAHIHLWQFLKELLGSPQVHGSCIRWLDQSRGVFKIEDSVRVARLWGLRKNRPAMNYDKLSRSIRQYYRKGIMRKTERSQRLVYQFCHPYGL